MEVEDSLGLSSGIGNRNEIDFKAHNTERFMGLEVHQGDVKKPNNEV